MLLLANFQLTSSLNDSVSCITNKSFVELKLLNAAESVSKLLLIILKSFKSKLFADVTIGGVQDEVTNPKPPSLPNLNEPFEGAAKFCLVIVKSLPAPINNSCAAVSPTALM